MWLQGINESSFPAVKNAGMKALFTCSIAFKLYISKLALLFTVFLRKDKATPTTNLGNLVYY